MEKTEKPVCGESPTAGFSFSNPRYVLGVDPGKDGAIALWDIEKKRLRVWDFRPHKKDMPPLMHLGCVMEQVHCLLSDHKHETITILENPHSMPENGHDADFSFGKSCGWVEAFLTAYNFDFIPVDPAAWKSSMGLSKDKQESLILAREVFKKDQELSKGELFKFKRHNNRAEAALLAWFGVKNLL